MCQKEVGGGYEFNSERVLAAIMQYVDDWFEGRVVDEVETKRREVEEIRKQREADRVHNRPTWKHG